MQQNNSKRLTVFSIRPSRGGSVWVRAGTAFVNKDGSLNVLLDVLPLDGKLHVREAAEKFETAPRQPEANQTFAAPGGEQLAAGGQHA